MKTKCPCGPHTRAVAVSAVPGDGTTFYFGSVDGGVWKTTNAGTTWKPIFDGQPVASIGALSVAPSNPEVIYAGTGENGHTLGPCLRNGRLQVKRWRRATWQTCSIRGRSLVWRILPSLPRNRTSSLRLCGTRIVRPGAHTRRSSGMTADRTVPPTVDRLGRPLPGMVCQRARGVAWALPSAPMAPYDSFSILPDGDLKGPSIAAQLLITDNRNGTPTSNQ